MLEKQPILFTKYFSEEKFQRLQSAFGYLVNTRAREIDENIARKVYADMILLKAEADNYARDVIQRIPKPEPEAPKPKEKPKAKVVSKANKVNGRYTDKAIEKALREQCEGFKVEMRKLERTVLKNSGMLINLREFKIGGKLIDSIHYSELRGLKFNSAVEARVCELLIDYGQPSSDMKVVEYIKTEKIVAYVKQALKETKQN